MISGVTHLECALHNVSMVGVLLVEDAYASRTVE